MRLHRTSHPNSPEIAARIAPREVGDRPEVEHRVFGIDAMQ